MMAASIPPAPDEAKLNPVQESGPVARFLEKSQIPTGQIPKESGGFAAPLSFF